MPFSTVRKSLPERPVAGFCGGKSGCSLSHCSSVSSCLRTMSPFYQLCRHTLASHSPTLMSSTVSSPPAEPESAPLHDLQPSLPEHPLGPYHPSIPGAMRLLLDLRPSKASLTG